MIYILLPWERKGRGTHSLPHENCNILPHGRWAPMTYWVDPQPLAMSKFYILLGVHHILLCFLLLLLSLLLGFRGAGGRELLSLKFSISLPIVVDLLLWSSRTDIFAKGFLSDSSKSCCNADRPHRYCDADKTAEETQVYRWNGSSNVELAVRTGTDNL